MALLNELQAHFAIRSPGDPCAVGSPHQRVREDDLIRPGLSSRESDARASWCEVYQPAGPREAIGGDEYVSIGWLPRVSPTVFSIQGGDERTHSGAVAREAAKASR